MKVKQASFVNALLVVVAVFFVVVAAAAAASPLSATAVIEDDGDDALLNEAPFIFTHDAATGYLKDNLVTRWAKTQPVGFAGQLDCGARGFDLRPKVMDDGSLLMHHGDVIVHETVSNGMKQVANWTSHNPTELVIIYVTDCEGTNCTGRVKAVFGDIGISYIDDCTELKGMTVGAAKKRAASGRAGGLPLAIFGCVDEQYDPSVECYLKEPAAKGGVAVCYDPVTRLIPLKRFWNSLVENTQQPLHRDTGELWMAQAHWQYSTDSVIDGLAHDSSILLDEQRSQVNKMLVSNITAGAFKYINIVEVDNVCDYGNDIRKALLSVFWDRNA